MQTAMAESNASRSRGWERGRQAGGGGGGGGRESGRHSQRGRCRRCIARLAQAQHPMLAATCIFGIRSRVSQYYTPSSTLLCILSSATLHLMCFFCSLYKARLVQIL